MDIDFLRKQVDSSGFPFQLKVIDAVRASQDTHGWRVEAEEHAWQIDGASGFIDLLLSKDDIWTSRATHLVVECKRVREGAWIFLPKKDDAFSYDRVVEIEPSHGKPVWCHARWAGPASLPLTSYCVVPGQGDKGTPMLERIGSQLVIAAEALADAYTHLESDDPRAVFSPLIVTNAPLMVCDFEIDQVSLAKGNLPDSAEFKPVEAVRFRKALLSCFDVAGALPNTIEQANEQDQRTVFVVHAPHLIHFLSGWAIQLGR